MNTQALYVSSAISGAALGVGLAFVVLLFATQHLRVAVFATLTILCTLLSVSGCMAMFGWTLGTIEAILISITAGFSVDYVVHLAHAMVQKDNGHGPDAGEKSVREAFSEMGVLVLSGMTTSIGASIFLFACQVQFFAKFGAFLCITIAFSWIYADFFFPALVATFGIGFSFQECKQGHHIDKSDVGSDPSVVPSSVE